MGQCIDEFFDLYSLRIHAHSGAVTGFQVQHTPEKMGFTFYLLHYIQSR
jgi:hypothetical protein